MPVFYYQTQTQFDIYVIILYNVNILILFGMGLSMSVSYDDIEVGAVFQFEAANRRVVALVPSLTSSKSSCKTFSTVIWEYADKVKRGGRLGGRKWIRDFKAEAIRKIDQSTQEKQSPCKGFIPFDPIAKQWYYEAFGKTKSNSFDSINLLKDYLEVTTEALLRLEFIPVTMVVD